jgi:hypothetical protein
MHQRVGRTLAALFVAGALVAACGSASTNKPAKVEAVAVEKIEGGDLERLTLSAKAAERLGVETGSVDTHPAGGTGLTSVPYSSVVYDRDGLTWAYTSPTDLVFVRQEITVDRIDGDRAILTSGPAVGTRVVTVGAAELWGVETGVGGGH